MTTPSNISTGRPLGFGFGRPTQATPTSAPAAAPAAPVSTPPAAVTTPASEAALATGTTETAAAASTVGVGDAGTHMAVVAPGVGEGAAAESTGEIVKVAVLRNDGSRASAIFGGVFGSMEGSQFRVDPMLKSIYLLQLVDGATPGGASDGAAAGFGQLPELIEVPVPVELAAGFKATLAHLSGTRWNELYDQHLRDAPPMTRFALESDARKVNETVARIVEQSGSPFTVQVAVPVRQVFGEAADSADEYDDDFSYAGMNGTNLVARPVPLDASPTVTASAGDALATLNPDGFRALHVLMQTPGRVSGDVVTYNQVDAFAVIAPDAAGAERVLALIPRDLKRATAQLVTAVQVNGEPYEPPMEHEAEEHQGPTDRP